MYQLYRLIKSKWCAWEEPFRFPSRRKAIAFFRLRYNYRNIKVRKVE